MLVVAGGRDLCRAVMWATEQDEAVKMARMIMEGAADVTVEDGLSLLG